MQYDVIIVGGGPAGMSAALYAARGGLKTLVVEKMYVGGQAALTYEIENYPAIESISGSDLALKMQAQAEKAGAEFMFDEIVSAELNTNPKKVITSAGGEFTATAVIIATGAVPRGLGIEAEARFVGRGVSYCATCDGAFYKGKTVAVVGGGNTAIEDALYLTRFAAKVYLIHRRQGFRAATVLVDRLNSSSVEQLLDSIVVDLQGEKKLQSVTVRNVVDQKLHTIDVDGIFVAIGQIPDNKLLGDVASLDNNGYVITNEHMETGVDGVFCCGDVRKKPLRQVVTACADGAIAAEAAGAYISKKG